jgi:glycosyltransferase involved in cell wall biosynthesis
MRPPRTDIDVVVVVWNDYVRFVGAAVEAAREIPSLQSIIVVDNASAVALPPLPRNVTVIRTSSRLTIGAARNIGLAAVEAPYVLFLDVDDALDARVIQQLVERLAATPGASTVAGALVRLYPDDRPGRRRPHAFISWIRRAQRLWFLVNLVKNGLPIIGCAVHRTTSCVDAGGFSELDYGEDWSLANALLLRQRVLLDGRVALLHRRHGRSLGLAVGPREIRQAACCIRSRVRNDPATPRWVRHALPAVSVLHALNSFRIARRYARELARISTRYGPPPPS